VRLIKLSRCIEPSRLRLSHRVTILLAALRSRLDLDVQGCRLLRAIKFAQSRGCKGVFCKHFPMNSMENHLSCFFVIQGIQRAQSGSDVIGRSPWKQ
jgi:hypothetical protein